MKSLHKLVLALLVLSPAALGAAETSQPQPRLAATDLGYKVDQAVAEWRVLRLQAMEVPRLEVRALIPLKPRPSPMELGSIAADGKLRQLVNQQAPLPYLPLIYAPSNTFVPVSASQAIKPVAVICVSGCEGLFRPSGAQPDTSVM